VKNSLKTLTGKGLATSGELPKRIWQIPVVSLNLVIAASELFAFLQTQLKPRHDSSALILAACCLHSGDSHLKQR